jgi:uncharacterized protein YkwD
MRKTTLILTSLSLVILLTGLSAWADLFLPAPTSIAPPKANPELVLRQRVVGIDWNAFSVQPSDLVQLNLFADVTLTLVCDRVSEVPVGNQIWLGHLAGETPPPITMVFDSGRLATTLVTPEVTYKVRPMDAEWHLVREIQRTGESAALWAAAATSDERSVWALTNQERAENNLPGLSLNGDLVASARAHSADMAAQNYFSHTSLDGRSAGERIAATGYEAWSWGENIIAGPATPQTVVDGWMNSEGHKANILSSNYCDIGVGYAYDGASQYRHYWTQNFGRQSGVSECPVVSDDSGEAEDGAGDASSGDGGSSSSGGGCFIGAGLETPYR